jgi:hypothetical protein
MNRGLVLLLAALGLGAVAGGGWLATAPLEARVSGAAQALTEARAEAAALEARITAFQAADDSAALPEELVLREATAEEAALALQERLVTLARAHDVDLSSLTAAAPPDALTLPAAALTVEGQGTLPDVMAFLDALERQTPRLGLSQLMLTPQNEPGRLSLRLTAWGLLNGEAG